MNIMKTFLKCSAFLASYIRYMYFFQEHSAYIEVAELLTETDPLGAVDIYCKFPIPPNPTFNDAYIFGEIVRLLFKAEKYDDSRLLSNMIALGKIMGLGMYQIRFP